MAVDPRLGRLLSVFALSSGALAGLLGIAVLLGWILDVPALKFFLATSPAMVPNTALMFILSGAALLLLASRVGPRWRWIARVLAALATLLAVSTLAEYVLGRDLGVDRLLLVTDPARPAPQTAAGFVSVGAALLALDWCPRPGFRPSEVLILPATAVALLALGGYLFGAELFYSAARYPRVGMAVHTAAGLLLLGTGTFAARPYCGWVSGLASANLGGQVGRRVLWIVLAIPLMGLLGALAQGAGMYPPPGASVVASVGSMFAAVAIILIVTFSLNRTDVERQRAEAEVRRVREQEAAQRAWLEAVLEQTPEAVVVVDREARVLAQNRAALSYVAPDVPGAHALTALCRPSGEPLPPEEGPVHAALAEGRTTSGLELALRAPDGALVPIVASVAPVRVGDRLAGSVALFRDIRARKELERMREEWSTLIAHDLRQPVNAIDLGLQLLAQRGLGADEALIQRVRGSVRNLERMIGDLLDVSRIEARRLRLQPVPVDLRGLVEQAVQAVPGAAERCRIRIETGRRVLADAGRLQQVLGNLLSNALKYGAADTEIGVEARPTGDFMQISVTNEGPGIPADELPSLFQRFVRTRSAVESRVPGIGLGLYITRGLVEAQGGRIWAESTPGERTTFHFTLPLAPAS